MAGLAQAMKMLRNRRLWCVRYGARYTLVINL